MSRNLEYQVSHHCSLGAGCGRRERPGACAQVVAARVAHNSLSCGCKGWRPPSRATSSMLGHQGPGEQPSGQRETHAWTLTLRAQRCLKRRQTLGNQEEEDVSLSWQPWARGPSFQCWPKATCVCAGCVHVAHAWPESPKRFPPWRPPPLTGRSCADSSGSWVGFWVRAD